MACRSQNLKVCQASELNCKMFSNFMHSEVKCSNELCLAVKLPASCRELCLRLDVQTLRSKVFYNPEYPEETELLMFLKTV